VLITMPTTKEIPVDTAGALIYGRFSGVHQWPLLGVHRGHELRSPGAPLQIREILGRSEEWLEALSAPPVSGPILTGLDPGEMEAIALAVRSRADLIVLYEACGRRAASEQFGLQVLACSACGGLIDAGDVLWRCCAGRTFAPRQSSFNFSRDLLPLAAETRQDPLFLACFRSYQGVTGADPNDRRYAHRLEKLVWTALCLQTSSVGN